MANFLWGSGGAKLTPEEIALQRSLIARRKAQGVDVSPIASPLQGLARVVDALGDRYQEGQLNDAATENAKVNQDILASLLGGGSSAASTGAAASLSPAIAPVTSAPLPDVVGEVANAATPSAAGEWLRYANQGATRNKPLDPKLVSALSFLPELGVTAEVFSGGQDAEGPNRTGSRRHDHGGAGDFRFYKDGRQLDWSNDTDRPIFEQIVQRGKASGITGFGAGPGYMSPGTMHVGFGTPSVWGAGGKGTNAPDWLRQAYGQAATVANQQVAQAQTIAPTNSLGVSPAVLQALTSPYANEQTQGVAKLLLQQQQSQAAQQQKLALAEQQRQQEIARRQAIAQQNGINPAYALDNNLWEGATKQLFADAPTATVNGIVVNTRTGQPVFTAPQEPTTAIQEFEYGVGNPAFVDRQDALRRASAPTTEGAIPPGYQANRDSQGRVVSMAPIPGGPEDRTKKEALQANQKENASDVITNAAVRAVQALNASGMPSTGLTGRLMSMNPSSNAAEVRRQASVLGANASTENINAMRAASPTGGALGAASDADLALLRAKSGALDPDSPTFERDVKDYTRTLLRLVHGNEAGDAAFNAINWSSSGEVPTEIPGVTIRRKGQ